MLFCYVELFREELAVWKQAVTVCRYPTVPVKQRYNIWLYLRYWLEAVLLCVCLLTTMLEILKNAGHRDLCEQIYWWALIADWKWMKKLKLNLTASRQYVCPYLRPCDCGVCLWGRYLGWGYLSEGLPRAICPGGFTPGLYLWWVLRRHSLGTLMSYIAPQQSLGINTSCGASRIINFISREWQHDTKYKIYEKYQ